MDTTRGCSGGVDEKSVLTGTIAKSAAGRHRNLFDEHTAWGTVQNVYGLDEEMSVHYVVCHDTTSDAPFVRMVPISMSEHCQ